MLRTFYTWRAQKKLSMFRLLGTLFPIRVIFQQGDQSWEPQCADARQLVHMESPKTPSIFGVLGI